MHCSGISVTQTLFLHLVHSRGPGEKQNVLLTLEAERPAPAFLATLASGHTPKLIKGAQHNSDLEEGPQGSWGLGKCVLGLGIGGCTVRMWRQQYPR